MSNAFGGVTNLVIIVFFLVLVMGYLAFNVQYSKAFKVKNMALTTLEQYEGNCAEADTKCNEKIQAYIKQIGYGVTKINNPGSCPNGGSIYHCNNGYCYCVIDLPQNSDDMYKSVKREYYHVITEVEMNIPIINKVLEGIRFFRVSGDSKPVSKFR